MQHFHPTCIGIVKIDIFSLEFLDVRELDNKVVKGLLNVFLKSTVKCDRESEKNYIPAIVNIEALEAILTLSGQTRYNLQRTLKDYTYRPRIKTGNIAVLGLNGKHRIEAAKQVLSDDDCWWTIKLWVPDVRCNYIPSRKCKLQLPGENCPTAEFIRKHGGDFSHETKFSAGEIYRNVRQWKEDDNLVQDWMLCLPTESMRTNLKQLLGQEMLGPGNLVESLDNLLKFPGLWVGFQLGNIKWLLALHTPQEFICNFDRIHKYWNTITLGDPSIQRCVDIETVQCLELCAPLVSQSDRHSIQQGMKDRTIFRGVTDIHLREAIEREILSTRGIIPTIRSFHENSKYFEIGARIIRTHLLPKSKKTLYQSMSDIWKPPTKFMVEVQEGIFENAKSPVNIKAFDLAYLMIFLSAFRQFSNLSDESPRQDGGSEECHKGVESNYVQLFLRRAHFLGFSNRKIIDGINNSLVLELPAALTAAYTSVGETKPRRWNRPFASAYRQIQSELFLPTLNSTACADAAIGPSVSFVQHDFLVSFFGISVPDLGIVTSPESCNLLIAQNQENINTSLDRIATLSPVATDRELGTDKPARGSIISSRPKSHASATLATGREPARSFGPARELGMSSYTASDYSMRSSRSSSYTRSLRPDNSPLVGELATQLREATMYDVVSPNSDIVPSAFSSPFSISYYEKHSSQPHGHTEFCDAWMTSTIASMDIMIPDKEPGEGTSPFDSRAETQQFDGENAHKELRFSTPQTSGNNALEHSPPRSYLSPKPRKLKPISLQKIRSGHGSKSFESPTATPKNKYPQLEFVEFNGMRKLVRSTANIDAYLKNRTGWIAMILEKGIPRTIDPSYAADYIKRGGLDGGKTFALVKSPYGENFRSQLKNTKNTSCNLTHFGPSKKKLKHS